MSSSRSLWAPYAALAVLSGLALAGSACTDAQLRCIGPACQSLSTSSTNVIKATGKVCTVDPKSSIYPYKIVVVVDISGSTQQTDPLGGRGMAVRQLFAQYKDNPSVSFAVVTFDTNAVALQRTFTRDPALLAAAAAQVDTHGMATNYLDTLALVRDIIDSDAKAASPGSNRFTQYDVQWLSDGNPEVPPDIIDEATLEQHCSQTRPKVAQAMNALMALKAQDNFYNITLSTIFLDYVPANPALALVVNCQPLINRDRATWGTGPDYLKDMQTIGRGTFQQLTSANLKFNININTIVRRFQSHRFFLTNDSRVVRADKLLPDSDQDGLADSEEVALKLDPTRQVTGSRGCGDLAWARSIDNPGMCDQACSGQATLGATQLAKPGADDDTDGLLACEETVLLSDDTKPDTNLDGIPDLTAVRFSSNPIDPKTNTTDTDLDGVTDSQEIMNGTDPSTAQSDQALAYVYSPLQPTAATTEATDCYTFQVDNVRLVETTASQVSAPGDNVICVQMVQNSVDDPTGQPTVTRACKTANYRQVDGVAKLQPDSAELTFTPADFVPIMLGSPAAHS